VMFSNLFDERKQQSEIEIPADGISLDLLRAVYRSNQLPLPTRLRAAIAALPHEVPRLAVTAQVTENDIATLLDCRIARFQEMRENKVINGEKVIPEPKLPDTPTPAPPTPAPLTRLYDKRHYRRI